MRHGVPEADSQRIMRGVVAGLDCVHAHGICHRDLKPENVLVSLARGGGRDVVKICDFGLCERVGAPGTRLCDLCGSPGFFAPEMITLGRYDGRRADVWSLGCILLELVLGHEQFYAVWMSAYDHEVIQSPQRFGERIRDATRATTALLGDGAVGKF